MKLGVDHLERGIEVALQVAHQPGYRVATTALLQVDPHPVVADIDPELLAHVQIHGSDFGGAVSGDGWAAPEPERRSRREQLTEEGGLIVNLFAESGGLPETITGLSQRNP
ncbi:hypothetical protein ACN27J_20330 [Solwaraspora sp. WMMB762]|uniref:hypothetical protein n=1 Tax=Solwaraspora sp. WMMB762 TaxID=3404120 RepID=UPI003B949D12